MESHGVYPRVAAHRVDIGQIFGGLDIFIEFLWELVKQELLGHGASVAIYRLPCQRGGENQRCRVVEVDGVASR